MSESLWKSSFMVEDRPEEPVEEKSAEPAEESTSESVSEATSEAASDASAEAKSESSDLTLSMDDFTALEDRIHRAVNLVKWERQARSTAEERAATAEAQLREQAPLAENLQKEVSALRGEREQVRQRVERLLSQMDALEL
ncbi:MAG: hypothetical protein ABR907_00755 [Terracidiphilus sp.]|jgi:cytoskeletal protein RodZ